MELVKGNAEAVANGTETVTKTTDVSTVVQKTLAPYLRDGVDAAKVVQEVEVALIKFGSRKATDFLLQKFNSL